MALISSPISTPQTMPVVARGSLARAPGFKYLTRAEFDAAVISERKNITLASANYAKGERLYIQGEEGYRSWFIGFGDNLTAIAATSHARTVVYSERTTRVLALDTSVAHSTEGAPEGSVGADGDEAIDRVTGHIYLKILGVWDYATTDGSYTEGAGVPGPMGPPGPIGLTGPGLLVLGVVETETDLPETGNTAGDAYLIDGDTYVWTSDEVWQNVGRFQGSKGDKGDKGDQGDIGAQGIQGVKGDQGIQGPIGLTGSQGVKGDTGDQGIQGLQGDTGETGAIGPKGDTGAKGDIGEAFAVNATGTLAARSTYDTQPAGYTYLATDASQLYIREGVSGWSAGIPFGKGDAGIQGIPGIKGEPGEQGDQGMQGIQGIQGIAGTKGDKGDKGDQGIQGVQGEQGIQGEKGDQGIPGSSGSTDAYTRGEVDTFMGSVVAKTVTLPASVDLNTVTTSGFYRLTLTPVNGPGTSDIRHSQMIVSSDGETISQLLFQYSDNRTYTRTGYLPVTWGAWSELASTAYVASAPVSPAQSNADYAVLNAAEAFASAKADARYGKNNILGTVSESGGVPTGAVIERGSNANGEYTRWADGTQICTRSAILPVQAHLTSMYTEFAWAAGFYDVPVSQHTLMAVIGTGSAAGIGVLVYNGIYSSSGPTSGVITSYAYRASTTSTGATGFLFSVTAVGRWF